MIRLDNVVCNYKGKMLLDHISVQFADGQIHGIVGHNGSGKTMLLKCVSGYLQPDSGAVQIGDKVLYRDVPFPPSMGVILENPGFLPYASGLQNLMWLANIKKKITKADVICALELVGLSGAKHKLVGQYSLGMKQRLGIAQAIMENPQLLILDEPFNALDAAGVEQMRSLLMQLRNNGATILLTSHYHEDIEMLCDAVYPMQNGSLCTETSGKALHHSERVAYE